MTDCTNPKHGKHSHVHGANCGHTAIRQAGYIDHRQSRDHRPSRPLHTQHRYGAHNQSSRALTLTVCDVAFSGSRPQLGGTANRRERVSFCSMQSIKHMPFKAAKAMADTRLGG
jgi:hypothetical protein